MNYGARQERAEMLVQVFRRRGDLPLPPFGGRVYTGSEVADEIEAMSDLGRGIVAVGGFVLQALNATPEFFKPSKKAKPS
jgi:hypothetical protein